MPKKLKIGDCSNGECEGSVVVEPRAKNWVSALLRLLNQNPTPVTGIAYCATCGSLYNAAIIKALHH